MQRGGGETRVAQKGCEPLQADDALAHARVVVEVAAQPLGGVVEMNRPGRAPGEMSSASASVRSAPSGVPISKPAPHRWAVSRQTPSRGVVLWEAGEHRC